MKIRVLLMLFVALSLGFDPLYAQQPSAQGAGPPNPLVMRPVRDQFREQFNENTLFLMGGPLGQSDIAYASDISTVLNDGLNLRVLPVVGSAAVKNVEDVLLLRGVDLAVTDVATLTALRNSKEPGTNLEKRIAYISVLYPQEMHVLARAGINSIEDLRSRKVNFDVAGSGSALHLPGIFRTLGIDVQPQNMSQLDAIERMRNGDLDATVCICAKPVDAFLSIRPESGFRLIGVPHVASLPGDLLPAPITGADYPGFLPADAFIETIATTAVIITFNWPKGSLRYSRTAKFVDAFFSKFAEFRKPPRQPGWQTINLAATIPGWQRFPPAQEWLENNNRAQSSRVKAEFDKFVAERHGNVNATTQADNDRLLRQYLETKGNSPN